MGRRATHGGGGESGRGAGGDGLGDGGVGCGGGGSCAVERVFGVIALMHARACMLSNGALLGRHFKIYHPLIISSLSTGVNVCVFSNGVLLGRQ